MKLKKGNIYTKSIIKALLYLIMLMFRSTKGKRINLEATFRRCVIKSARKMPDNIIFTAYLTHKWSSKGRAAV